MKVVKINGTIGMDKDIDVDHNKFLDEFLEFLDSKGMYYAGSSRIIEEEDLEDKH